MSVEFDESIIKKLTGSEEIKARQIFAHPDRFYPTMKLWFSMNHKPIVDTSDTAILRRLLIIPFENVVAGGKDEKQGYAKRLFEEEASGILNRLLGGLKLWLEEGLQKETLPLAIAHATGEYCLQKHVIQQFFARTDAAPDLWETAGYLHAAYKLWAAEVNVIAMDGKSFAAELGRRQFESRRGETGYIWRGVRLREPYRSAAITAFEKEKARK